MLITEQHTAYGLFDMAYIDRSTTEGLNMYNSYHLIATHPFEICIQLNEDWSFTYRFTAIVLNCFHVHDCSRPPRKGYSNKTFQSCIFFCFIIGGKKVIKKKISCIFSYSIGNLLINLFTMSFVELESLQDLLRVGHLCPSIHSILPLDRHSFYQYCGKGGGEGEVLANEVDLP